MPTKKKKSCAQDFEWTKIETEQCAIYFNFELLQSFSTEQRNHLAICQKFLNEKCEKKECIKVQTYECIE